MFIFDLVKSGKMTREKVAAAVEEAGYKKNATSVYISAWKRGDRVPGGYEQLVQNEKTGVLKFK